MRTEKGQPGYVKARKQKYLLGAVVEFAIVIAIFVTGYIQTGSRLNLLTVVAVVGCLPAAKMLVEFITMAPYKSCLLYTSCVYAEKLGIPETGT